MVLGLEASWELSDIGLKNQRLIHTESLLLK